MVFVACVVVELEELKSPVVVAAALSVAESDALSVALPLDVELGEGDCEDDWESEDKACQLRNHLSIGYILLL